MNILLVGPQGSGKGTQAEKLIEKFGLAHVEMGGLLRQISKEESELGLKVKEIINSGQLVPDEMTIEILNNYLQSINRLDGILFDGFPRVVSQAEYFDKFMAEKGKKLDAVVSLTLPREEVFQRLVNRRTCSKCGKVFNVLTKPSKVEGVCDYCQGELIVRADETPEKIEKRLNAFEQQTVPMINHYRQQGIVEEIDGNRPIEVIFEEIVERLKNRGLLDA
jgi:adenylate kinase